MRSDRCSDDGSIHALLWFRNGCAHESRTPSQRLAALPPRGLHARRSRHRRLRARLSAARHTAKRQHGRTAPRAAAGAPCRRDGRAVFGRDDVRLRARYSVGENAAAYDDDDPAALTDFHGTLDPYGSWVDDGTYGTVWVPASGTVGADFSPYETAGHWVYDDGDWVWVSDYPWGWAPFHYGRWVYVEGRGWSWIPGRVYRGAWVAWAVDPGYAYVGWAPLGPAFVWFGGRPVFWHAYVGPRWVYCSHDAGLLRAHPAARVVTGPAAASFSGRMHAYVSASPSVSGPAPGRLGFKSEQVPHTTAGGSQGVSRAVAFSRPSTAQSMGGSAPSRAFAGAHPSSTAGTHVTTPQSADGAARTLLRATARLRSRGPATNGAPRAGRRGTGDGQRPAAVPSVGPHPGAPAGRYSPPPSHSSGGGHHH